MMYRTGYNPYQNTLPVDQKINSNEQSKQAFFLNAGKLYMMKRERNFTGDNKNNSTRRKHMK